MIEKDFSLLEQEELMRRTNYTSGDFESWLSKVNKIISSYVKKYSTLSCGAFEPEDLYLHGWTLMLESLKWFDGSKMEFMRFFDWYLSRKFFYEISTLRSGISAGSDLTARKNAIIKCKKDFEQENGFEPSCEVLADLSGYTPKQVEESLDLYKITGEPLSLNKLCDDEDSEFIDSLEDESERFEVSFEAEYSRDQFLKLMDEVLKREEAQVIRLSFGFIGGEKHTDQEIADILGYNNRQIINHIKHNAIKKLQRSVLQNNSFAA